MAQTSDLAADLEALWDFSDASGTEAKFRSFLEEHRDSDPSTRAEILSQLARALGLQRRFDEAEVIVDEARALSPDKSRSRLRVFLERGRILNSSGKPKEAAPFFIEAWDLAREIGEDGFAVNSAHMIAIVEVPDQQIVWNKRALDLARSSPNLRAQRWQASLLNNLGWTYYDLGLPEQALPLFEEAVELRAALRNPVTERIARYCVGKCLRTLGRTEEALKIQLELNEKSEPENPGEGYGEEEIGECLLALNRADEAKPYFALAFEKLEKCGALRDEPERLARIKELAGV